MPVDRLEHDLAVGRLKAENGRLRAVMQRLVNANYNPSLLCGGKEYRQA